MGLLEIVGLVAIVVVLLLVFNYVHTRFPVYMMHVMMAVSDYKKRRDK